MKFEIFDINTIFNPDRVITNYDPLDRQDRFRDDSIFSPKLFSICSDGVSAEVKYSCDCGELKGKFNKGEICSLCNTPVKKHDIELSELGWIDLHNYYIINPTIFQILAKLIGGAKKLNAIINFNTKLDKDGNILDENDLSDTKDATTKYNNIGLISFKENFDDILKFIYQNSKNKDKDNIYSFIKNNKDCVFWNKIPVYDAILRPADISKNSSSNKPIFKFDNVNNNFNYILKISSIINDPANNNFDLLILPNLFNIQLAANRIYLKIIENISGKEGFIRSYILGARVNFSCRTVITPLPPNITFGNTTKRLNMDDIAIPYIAFIELYKYVLMNKLANLWHITLEQANQKLMDAQIVFDDAIYELCMDLVLNTPGGLKCLIDRNPSISRGSMLCCNIAYIKPDITDLTTSIHNCILQPLAADYDGDVINIFPLFDNQYINLFNDSFNPLSIVTSNNDGKYNPKTSINRDITIGIYQMCN